MKICQRYLILFCIACLPTLAQAQWFKDTQAIMGTEIRVELWDTSEPHARGCIDKVMTEMRRIDTTMSPFKPDSELSHINQLAAIHPVKIDKELFDLILRAQWASGISNGAFDITFASIGYRYDYRKGIKPSEDEIKQALPEINYKNIILDRKHSTIHFALKGVRIDLGGIAKGFAVDNSIAILRQCGIKEGLVGAGGDSRIIGDREGRPWMVGIRDPRKEGSSAIVIPLSNTAISTSGDYERYFIKDGVRYHHIINPKTGHSATASRSVTVLGPDATTTDALSTTLFIMGAKDGLRLVDTLPGIEAIMIDAEGKLHYSNGLMDPNPKH